MSLLIVVDGDGGRSSLGGHRCIMVALLAREMRGVHGGRGRYAGCG
jgi:hypothetical protein